MIALSSLASSSSSFIIIFVVFFIHQIKCQVDVCGIASEFCYEECGRPLVWQWSSKECRSNDPFFIGIPNDGSDTVRVVNCTVPVGCNCTLPSGTVCAEYDCVGCWARGAEPPTQQWRNCCAFDCPKAGCGDGGCLDECLADPVGVCRNTIGGLDRPGGLCNNVNCGSATAACKPFNDYYKDNPFPSPAPPGATPAPLTTSDAGSSSNIVVTSSTSASVTAPSSSSTSDSNISDMNNSTNVATTSSSSSSLSSSSTESATTSNKESAASPSPSISDSTVAPDELITDAALSAEPAAGNTLYIAIGVGGGVCCLLIVLGLVAFVIRKYMQEEHMEYTATAPPDFQLSRQNSLPSLTRPNVDDEGPMPYSLGAPTPVTADGLAPMPASMRPPVPEAESLRYLAPAPVSGGLELPSLPGGAPPEMMSLRGIAPPRRDSLAHMPPARAVRPPPPADVDPVVSMPPSLLNIHQPHGHVSPRRRHKPPPPGQDAHHHHHHQEHHHNDDLAPVSPGRKKKPAPPPLQYATLGEEGEVILPDTSNRKRRKKPAPPPSAEEPLQYATLPEEDW